jgi:hypothetical protein
MAANADGSGGTQSKNETPAVSEGVPARNITAMLRTSVKRTPNQNTGST